MAGLVEQLSDNPAAKLTAQEIARRVQTDELMRAAHAALHRGAGLVFADAGGHAPSHNQPALF